MITQSLLARFRAAGLTVVEMAGWEARGETDGPFTVRGILLHHDGMGLHNDDVPNNMSQNGVDGAQLWIKYTGEIYVLAAGRKWHAGIGGPWNSIPQDHGNDWLIGIETDHTNGQPWFQEQTHTMSVAGACIVQEYGIDVRNWCCGHLEYTGPQSNCPGRKEDPESYNLDAWRTAISGTTPIPPPTPPEDTLSAAEVQQITAHIDAKFAELAASKSAQYGANQLIDSRFGLTDVVAAIAHRTGSIPRPAAK
jgi:N-acetylmuramoyl-L-alanine amidase